MQKKQQQKQGAGRNSSSSRTQEGSRARDADHDSRGGRELSRAQSQPMRAREGMSGAQRGATKEQGVKDIEPEAESTGTPDEHYNLVSVLYHALQGAEIYEEYVEDAEAAGDDELDLSRGRVTTAAGLAPLPGVLARGRSEPPIGRSCVSDPRAGVPS
jgi:hypothetical protein